MSNLFNVSDEVINPKDRNKSFKLNNDLLKGFKDSAENGQTRLALEYLIYMFDIINDELQKNSAQSMPSLKLTAEAETVSVDRELNTKKVKKQEDLSVEA